MAPSSDDHALTPGAPVGRRDSGSVAEETVWLRCGVRTDQPARRRRSVNRPRLLGDALRAGPVLRPVLPGALSERRRFRSLAAPAGRRRRAASETCDLLSRLLHTSVQRHTAARSAGSVRPTPPLSHRRLPAAKEVGARSSPPPPAPSAAPGAGPRVPAHTWRLQPAVWGTVGCGGR